MDGRQGDIREVPEGTEFELKGIGTNWLGKSSFIMEEHTAGAKCYVTEC